MVNVALETLLHAACACGGGCHVAQKRGAVLLAVCLPRTQRRLFRGFRGGLCSGPLRQRLQRKKRGLDQRHTTYGHHTAELLPAGDASGPRRSTWRCPSWPQSCARARLPRRPGPRAGQRPAQPQRAGAVAATRDAHGAGSASAGGCGEAGSASGGDGAGWASGGGSAGSASGGGAAGSVSAGDGAGWASADHCDGAGWASAGHCDAGWASAGHCGEAGSVSAGDGGCQRRSRRYRGTGADASCPSCGPSSPCPLAAAAAREAEGVQSVSLLLAAVGATRHGPSAAA
jgi:hypothetical protein